MAILKLNGTRAVDKRRCCVCGCTQFRAYPGGCYWVTDNLCSQCFKSSASSNGEKEMIIMDETDRLFSPDDFNHYNVIQKMLEEQIEYQKNIKK